MKELEMNRQEEPGREGRPFSIDRNPPVRILLPRDFVGDQEVVRNIAADIDESTSFAARLMEQILLDMDIDAGEESAAVGDIEEILE